jgi:KamA family protein
MVGNRPQNGKKTMNPKSLRKFFQNASAKDWSNWRWQMQNRVTLPEKLPDFHDISPVLKEEMRKVLPSYPMAVTPYFLSLISEYDGLGPVAAQCLPNIKEIKILENFPKDPLGEDGNMPIPKLIHRYPDRVLAMVTQTCATYCRHCNRKRFWKTPQNFPLQKHLQQMVRYVAESPSIREVIISGGDPLTFDDAKLEMILDSFSNIPGVEILRIGSRMPSVLPMRITNDLCRMLNLIIQMKSQRMRLMPAKKFKKRASPFPIKRCCSRVSTTIRMSWPAFYPVCKKYPSAPTIFFTANRFGDADIFAQTLPRVCR